MKVIELLKSKEWSGKVIDCVLRFALSFALALAQVFGGYAPLALGMIGASGAGLRGVSALIGASAGAVLFLPFSHALRTFAAGVLIFTANNAFFDLKLYKKRAFLPLLCAGMMFSVEFVYVLRDGVGEAANCLMALLLCALGAMSGRALLSTGDKEKEDHPYAPLFILLGVLMAASSFETADGFAPGRILSMLAVLLFAFERGSAFAIPAALCIGLGMDLGAGGGSFVHAASYAFSAVLVNVTARGNRVASALWFALSILCFALPMNAHAGLVLLYEGLAATLLFLLIPSRFLRGKRLCSDEAASQYAQLSELMQSAADGALRPVSTQPVHSYEIGLSLRPKRGERVSGDSAAHFETEDGTLCLLLSDGMGCGEAAQRESSMAARLLERFLSAGIDAPPALKTLNSALSLRAESTDSFTTVDLLTLSLQTLEGELYKYGAAPSYLKRGGTVRRVTCSCLPAGLQEGSPPPEATHIKLSPGCFFVMLSDGVADSLDDEWLQNLLAGWEGHDPQQLVAAILADSMEKRGGTDDAGVLALYIPEDSGGAQAV